MLLSSMSIQAEVFDCQKQDLLLDIACPGLRPRHLHCLVSVKLQFSYVPHTKPSTFSPYRICGYKQRLSIELGDLGFFP